MRGFISGEVNTVSAAVAAFVVENLSKESNPINCRPLASWEGSAGRAVHAQKTIKKVNQAVFIGPFGHRAIKYYP